MSATRHSSPAPSQRSSVQSTVTSIPAIRRSLSAIYTRLYRAFGPQHWWPGDSPIEIAIGAILTQNTAWTNVEKAIDNLRRHRLLNLATIASLPPCRLAPLIRSAGFYNIKADRLHSFLEWLTAQGGFSGLRRIPTAALRQELLGLPGIGPETADSILLYACDRPVFVIDAYTRRILYRYGLIHGDESYQTLQAIFHKHLPRSVRLYNEYHALLVRLAKTHCRTQPLCLPCPLA